MDITYNLSKLSCFADLYDSIGFSTDVKGLPALMKRIHGPGRMHRHMFAEIWS